MQCQVMPRSTLQVQEFLAVQEFPDTTAVAGSCSSNAAVLGWYLSETVVQHSAIYSSMAHGHYIALCLLDSVSRFNCTAHGR